MVKTNKNKGENIMNRKLEKNIKVIEKHNIKFSETTLENRTRTNVDHWCICRSKESEVSSKRLLKF